MSNLSSVTLFHFTSSLEALESILINGLNFEVFAEKLPLSRYVYFVRGISFCNIPLSMISEHVEWYGTYAIGVKRSSLRELGASPVFYVHSKTKMFPRGNNAVLNLENNPFLGYFKQHYGTQFHKISNSYKYKKFYDEKEWRVFAGTPIISKYTLTSALKELREKMDHRIKREDPLMLQSDMIEYIILESQQDFPQFDDFLKKQYSKERDKYLTKILYYSQIKKDF